MNVIDWTETYPLNMYTDKNYCKRNGYCIVMPPRIKCLLEEYAPFKDAQLYLILFDFIIFTSDISPLFNNTLRTTSVSLSNSKLRTLLNETFSLIVHESWINNSLKISKRSIIITY